MFHAIDGRVETLFGDSIAEIMDDGQRVHLGFDHAADRTVDLVIGADGLHSRVRQLAFGPDAKFECALGYHVAAFEAAGYRQRDELAYVTHNAPGCQISRFSMRDDKTLFLFVFRDELMSGDADPKALLRHVFADSGWEWPQIEVELGRANDIYFDTVSQIRMDHWTNGRVALLGDAAACVSLVAGEGTGLAIAEAYVLAGELKAARDDHALAFTRYERRLMPFLRRKQRSAITFASAFAPKTSMGIRLRNAAMNVLRLPIIGNVIVGRSVRDDIDLPSYRDPL
jgi:2-polyprenyl-6-methoxyphenol hydroxylase-like FAD-dependent oxidoreductase